MITPAQAQKLIAEVSPIAVNKLNQLAGESLQTRGGRAGSGLGSLLEALWGFLVNAELRHYELGKPLDLAWFPDHAYNDFACVFADSPWDPTTKLGELLRVEAKSMFGSADESKGHFDALVHELGEYDLLLVLVWDWLPVAGTFAYPRVAPQVQHSFVGSAIEIARFRDALHIARGGRFVSPPCSDGCEGVCRHVGEPLNADGKRERRNGPETCKPRAASYAANFGGLVRMLKTNSANAREEFRRWRKRSEVVHDFVSFMHTAFPREEENQYLIEEWRSCAIAIGIPDAARLSREKLIETIRGAPNYQEYFRML